MTLIDKDGKAVLASAITASSLDYILQSKTMAGTCVQLIYLDNKAGIAGRISCSKCGGVIATIPWPYMAHESSGDFLGHAKPLINAHLARHLLHD